MNQGFSEYNNNSIYNDEARNNFNQMASLLNQTNNKSMMTNVPLQPLNTVIDPTLTEILRRPPVGISSSAMNTVFPLSQNNTIRQSPVNSDMMTMMMMQQNHFQKQPQSLGLQNPYPDVPRMQFAPNPTGTISMPSTPNLI